LFVLQLRGVSSFVNFIDVNIASEKMLEVIYIYIYIYTGSGAHPASCTMGTGCPFPGGKSAAVA
jgi:hypothetical protein